MKVSKVLKKFLLSLSVCAAIATMVVSPVSAQSNPSNTLEGATTMEATIDISDIELGKKVVLPDGAILTPITQEEYLSRLAAEKNISLKEAYNMEATSLRVQSLFAPSSTTYYYDYVKTFSYSKNTTFKADLQATIKIYNSGSFRQIDDVITVSSRRRSGIYDYEWIETDAYSDPDRGSSEFPVISVTLGAKGYFEVRTSFSLDLSVDLPGFSAGGSSGGEFIYQSDTLSMRSTYRVY